MNFYSGAGWTSTFLLPLLDTSDIRHAATTRTGRNNTIPFTFDASSDSVEPYRSLPSASTILITFPLKGHGQSKRILELYRKVHGAKNEWVQLGSTGIWKGESWMDLNSPYDTEDDRAVAEDELRSLGGCVLNLAGLYGGERQPKTWVPRVATSKAQVQAKSVVHLIHGTDVARAIIATHRAFEASREKVVGMRYMLTDVHVYDWWDLIQTWGKEAREKARAMGIEERELEYEKWVGELMVEEGIRALPRDIDKLGRRLDGRAFWEVMGSWPEMGRVR